MKFKHVSKNTLFLLALTLFVQQISFAQVDQAIKNIDDNEISLKTYFHAVQSSVTSANAYLENKKTKWSITDIEVKLEGVQTIVKQGKVKIFFIKFGKNKTRSATSELTLKLATPKSEKSELAGPNIKQAMDIEGQIRKLTDYLKFTCETIDKGVSNNPYIIYPKSLSFKVNHTLKKSTEGGLEFSFYDEAVELSADNDGSSKSYIQTITFTAAREVPEEAKGE